MKTEMYDGLMNEPASEQELFSMLRPAFDDEKLAWEAVREAQAVFRDFTRQVILMEMAEEKEIIDLYQQFDRDAA